MSDLVAGLRRRGLAAAAPLALVLVGATAAEAGPDTPKPETSLTTQLADVELEDVELADGQQADLPLADAEPMEAPTAADGAEPGAAEEPDPVSDWRGTAEIYGFAPLRATGSVTIRGFESEVDDDLGDILSALDWLTFVRGSVEKGRWGVLTDLSYVKLTNTDGFTGPRGRFTGDTKVSSTQGIYDLALRYRFGDPESAISEPGRYSFIPYAGIRVLDLGLDVRARVREIDGDLRLGAERSFDRTWVQPLVGFQASYFLSPRLRAFARADIGGFDFSGAKDYSGNAQLGLGYAVGNNTDLTLSWRYLGINFDNGDARPNGVRSYQNGIEMGVKFFF